MQEARPTEWVDFSGGLSEAPRDRLAPNQLSVLENLYPYGIWLRRRNGIQALTQTPDTVFEDGEWRIEPCDAVMGFLTLDRTLPGQLDLGTFKWIVGRDDGISIYDPGNSSWKRVLGFPVQPYPEAAWDFHQYNNVVYACRRGAGLRVTRPPFDSFYPAGLQPPPATFTATEQTGGSLEADFWYEYVLTYRNNVSKAESNPSDPVRIQITADDAAVLLEDLPVPDALVEANEIRIWRSLKVADPPPEDDFGAYYYLGSINVGVTTYLDTKAQFELGSAVSFNNLAPPATVYLSEIWNERMFLSDGRVVFWSNVGSMEGYGASNYTLVKPDDGSVVTALRAWGDRLVIGKTEDIYYLFHGGTGRFSRDTLSDQHGCWSQDSMKSIEQTLIWYGGDNFYRSDGGFPYAISTTEIRDTLDRIPRELRFRVRAAVYPRNSWYVALVPQDTGEWVALCYNYKEQTWSKFRHWQNFMWIGSVRTPTIDDALFVTGNDGHVYNYDLGTKDRPGRTLPAGQTDPDTTPTFELAEEEPIVCRWGTSAFGVVGADRRQWMKRFRIAINTVKRNLLISLYRDDDVLQKQVDKPIDPRGLTGNRQFAREWKLYNLNTELLGAEHWVLCEYEGEEPILVKGMGVEVGADRDMKARAL